MAGDPTLRAIIDSSGAAVGAARFNAACQSMTNSAAATARSLISFKGAIGGLAIGLIAREIAQATREFIQAGDTFTMLNAKLGLFAQTGVQSADILQALMDAANRAHAPVGDLADIYTRNAAALNNLGVSTSEQVRLAESLYKTLVISGNATESGKEALIQFSQSLNSGVFRGQEFNSVNEQATEILRSMGRATGKTQGELRKMANDGMIPATLAANALLNDTQNIDAQFQKLPQTVEQASVRFSDMFRVIVGESVDATGSNHALAEAINEWTNTLSSPSFHGVIDWFSNGLKSIADYASSAAREIKIMAIETELAAEKQKAAAEQSQSSIGQWLSTAGTIFRMGLGFWADQAGAAMTGEFGMTPEMRRQIREQAEDIAGWNTTVTKATAVPTFNAGAAKKPIQFGSGAETEEDKKRRERFVSQLNKQIDLERTSIQIKQAEIAGDTSQVQVLQTQLEIRQKISDDMRKASPAKAAALESEIRQERALEIQLKAVQEVQERNNEFARDFAGTITDAFDSAIKGGQSFGRTLKQLGLDLIDVITKAALLDPLGKSIGISLSGALNGSGSSGFDIGNIFGLGGGDVGLGSWTPTITAFASGGIVDRPTGFAFGGGLGVAGEDGPEAILPLTRGPGGDLGVRAVGALGGTTVVNNWTLSVAGDATEATLARLQGAMEQLIAARTPGIIDRATSAVARSYKNDKNYLRR